MATHRGTRGSHARRRRWAALLGVTALAVTAGGALAAPAGAAAADSQNVDFATHCIPPHDRGHPADRRHHHRDHHSGQPQSQGR